MNGRFARQVCHKVGSKSSMTHLIHFNNKNGIIKRCFCFCVLWVSTKMTTKIIKLFVSSAHNWTNKFIFLHKCTGKNHLSVRNRSNIYTLNDKNITKINFIWWKNGIANLMTSLDVFKCIFTICLAWTEKQYERKFTEPRTTESQNQKVKKL